MAVAFIVWSLAAALFFYFGISSRKKEKPVGFFSNVKPPDVTDVKKYNRVVSNIWLIFAGVFELIGIPLLFAKQNGPELVFLMLGVFAWVIGIMIVYMTMTSQYRK